MNCPICAHSGHYVVRTERSPTAIRRCRRCIRCGHKWHTTERLEAELALELQRLARIRQALSPEG
jgi:transcriptional regulator NrdR family protein